MILDSWHGYKTVEESNLFNPAYCGALIYEFVRAYQNAKGSPVPFALVFCALPITLHPATRDRLPKSTRTILFHWLENNPDLLVGFSDRVRNLVPFLRDALRYATVQRTIGFEKNGGLTVGENRASFSPKLFAKVTSEIQETVRATRLVGRWFARSGDVPTILTAWGICI